MRKLETAQTSWKSCKISPNSVSSVLCKIYIINPKKHEMIVKTEYKEEFNRCVEKPEEMKDFGVEEVEVALKFLKNGKAAGVVSVLLEFLKHMDIKGKL